MKTLQELRLIKEVQERVLLNDGDVLMSLQQVNDHLYKEMDFLQDNDRLLQAIGVNKDIKIIEEWIELENNNYVLEDFYERDYK